ncbi:MAG: uncharacterized protein KVP18_003977 [Porospora cf. gigantea A]|uniref:uncharacterized protein n=2 Tax=Porospora cf. gigantea A TaxID=2853593 RepID=UPI00355967EB|nr:MAG: hypothetical protein KVP18_003977 [Porospora cf. gigantea A]
MTGSGTTASDLNQLYAGEPKSLESSSTLTAPSVELSVAGTFRERLKFPKPAATPVRRPQVVMAARMIGNIAFPMQGTEQYFQNLEYIVNLLPDGIYRRKSPDSALERLSDESDGAFNREWRAGTISSSETSGEGQDIYLKNIFLLNGLLNTTLERNLSDFLTKRDLLVQTISLNSDQLYGKQRRPRLVTLDTSEVAGLETLQWGGVSDPILYVTAQNRARNAMIELMLAAEADILMPLDGNIGMTAESLGAVLRGFGKSGESYNMPLLVRLNPRRDKASKPEDYYDFQRLTQKTLLPEVLRWSTMGEPQLIYQKSLKSSMFFGVNMNYGKKNKVKKIQQISRKGIPCSGVVHKNVPWMISSSNRRAQKYCTECGYFIRLPYWYTQRSSDLIVRLNQMDMRQDFDADMNSKWGQWLRQEKAQFNRVIRLLGRRKGWKESPMVLQNAMLNKSSNSTAVKGYIPKDKLLYNDEDGHWMALKKLERLAASGVDYNAEFRAMARSLAMKFFARQILSGKGLARRHLLRMQRDSVGPSLESFSRLVVRMVLLPIACLFALLSFRFIQRTRD